MNMNTIVATPEAPFVLDRPFRWGEPRRTTADLDNQIYFSTKCTLGFAGGDANLYRYCFNSPTNATDPSGESATVIGGAIGGVVGFFAGGFSAHDGWDWGRAWAGVGSGALVGAGIGLAIDTFGAATPLSVAMVGAGIGAGIGSAAGGGLLTTRDSVDWGGYGKGAVVGGVAGAVAGASYPMLGAYTAASSTYLGTFAAGAGSAMLGDAAGQGVEMAFGWRDGYSTTQTAFAGTTGGVLSVAGRGLGQAWSKIRYQRYMSGLETKLANRTMTRSEWQAYSRIQRVQGQGGFQQKADSILDAFIAGQPSNAARNRLGAITVAMNRRNGLAAIGTNGEIPGQIASSLSSRALAVGGVGRARGPSTLLRLNGSGGRIISGRCAEFRDANRLLLADPMTQVDDILFASTRRGARMPLSVLQPCFHCRNMFGLPYNLMGPDFLGRPFNIGLNIQFGVGSAGAAGAAAVY